jgi:hypothetical protein
MFGDVIVKNGAAAAQRPAFAHCKGPPLKAVNRRHLLCSVQRSEPPKGAVPRLVCQGRNPALGLCALQSSLRRDAPRIAPLPTTSGAGRGATANP